MNKLNVTLFGKQSAEKYVRHAYNIPVHVGCWKPYRVLLTSHGGVLAHSAFYTFAEFKRWLRSSGRKTQSPAAPQAELFQSMGRKIRPVLSV